MLGGRFPGVAAPLFHVHRLRFDERAIPHMQEQRHKGWASLNNPAYESLAQAHPQAQDLRARSRSQGNDQDIELVPDRVDL